MVCCMWYMVYYLSTLYTMCCSLVWVEKLAVEELVVVEGGKDEEEKGEKEGQMIVRVSG